MRELTFRTNPPARAAKDKTAQPEKRVDPLEGKRFRLSSKNPLLHAHNAYNRSARGKGYLRASQVVEGRGWSYYRLSGKDTILIGMSEPIQRAPFMIGRMEEVRPPRRISVRAALSVAHPRFQKASEAHADSGERHADPVAPSPTDATGYPRREDQCAAPAHPVGPEMADVPAPTEVRTPLVIPDSHDPHQETAMHAREQEPGRMEPKRAEVRPESPVTRAEEVPLAAHPAQPVHGQRGAEPSAAHDEQPFSPMPRIEAGKAAEHYQPAPEGDFRHERIALMRAPKGAHEPETADAPRPAHIDHSAPEHQAPSYIGHAAVSTRRAAGYISSAQRKVVQLKVAQSAASEGE